MDRKAFHQFTYGMFLVTAVAADGRRMGCVVNTAEQVTSDPYRVLLTLNKDNATCAAVQQTGKLAVTVLDERATMDLVGTFGFKTSAEVDKFAGFDVREVGGGIPWVADAAAAVLSCTVFDAIDAGSHMVFCAEVTDAQMCPDAAAPLTYERYRRVLKGSTPPKASSYVGDAPEAGTSVAAPSGDAVAAGDTVPAALHHFRCMLCGYVHETVDEELPADFKCPLCGAGVDKFQRID